MCDLEIEVSPRIKGLMPDQSEPTAKEGPKPDQAEDPSKEGEQPRDSATAGIKGHARHRRRALICHALPIRDKGSLLNGDTRADRSPRPDMTSGRP